MIFKSYVDSNSHYALRTSSFLTFPSLVSDVAIRQSNWDASKVRDKLRRDIGGHASSVRHAKLSEMIAVYEVSFSINVMRHGCLLDLGFLQIMSVIMLFSKIMNTLFGMESESNFSGCDPK